MAIENLAMFRSVRKNGEHGKNPHEECKAQIHVIGREDMEKTFIETVCSSFGYLLRTSIFESEREKLDAITILKV